VAVSRFGRDEVQDDRGNHLALLTRRAMLASALAEVAVHAIGTVAAEEAPRTVLRLQRRSIEVNAKSGLSNRTEHRGPPFASGTGSGSPSIMSPMCRASFIGMG
jgi:hypothetical protein